MKTSVSELKNYTVRPNEKLNLESILHVRSTKGYIERKYTNDMKNNIYNSKHLIHFILDMPAERAEEMRKFSPWPKDINK